ncbi:hypothetical protein GCM10009678_28950 [Actinomadura kijaniata]|uniref:tRNA(Ile2) C34 agmatinyltransferase TiaS n=1 Tax=Actinomadura namibiensis TaxID=182080 RepID=A0A7W3QK10_ACTNM|nr:hypothetical protein [Actinomadura namibiensis]MBA8949498.1 tRNA(Ile2) C34 agmatinyltransferase TiaS [Actinomadura namibiensis]
MTMRMPVVITACSCACGARTDRPGRRCRKCRARARWQRRRAGSRHPDLWN